MRDVHGMRRLVLVRHAKAVEDSHGEDHARVLSERGRREAMALGVWLVEHGIQPDVILCSTAARTRETLDLMAIYAPTILSDALYLATPQEMLRQVQSVESAAHTLMVIGHNPGTHALLGSLVGAYADPSDEDRVVLKFPTSGCAILSFVDESWRSIAPRSATLMEWYAPPAI